MRFQDYIVESTTKASRDAFKAAKAVPADKQEWKPLDLGRSVLDQCRELAKTPDWAYDIIAGEKEPDWSAEGMAQQQKEMSTWTTVEQCEQECNKRLERYFNLVRGFPDEKLTTTKWLPYDGGRDFTVMEMMEYPRWNYGYHEGQIAYIQTLYGDKEMH